MAPERPAAVFAYGSLVAAGSLAETLGRPPRRAWSAEERRPAILRGWRRRWSLLRDNRACEKTFALDADGSIPDHVLSLNIERSADPADAVSGLLIALSEPELARLDRRELRYDRFEATAEIESAEAAAAFSRIHSYTAKPANLAPRAPSGAVILRSYAAAVHAAFAGLGPEQLDLYLRTTEPFPLEPVEAHLVGDRIPPGNPRRW